MKAKIVRSAICKHCHKSFSWKWKRRPRLFCSRNCAFKFRVGDKNPAFRDRKIQAVCVVCSKNFSYYRGSKNGNVCSRKCYFRQPEVLEMFRLRGLSFRGKKASIESRRKMSLAGKGRKQSKEWVEKRTAVRLKNLEKRGRKVTGLLAIRACPEYKNWRLTIFKRDNFKCTFCKIGLKAGYENRLEVDHIIPLSLLYEELIIGAISKNALFDLENGRTLCRACHKKTDSFGRHARFTPERRLLEKIRAVWKQQGKQEDFKSFYHSKMSSFIEAVKEKLN